MKLLKGNVMQTNARVEELYVLLNRSLPYFEGHKDLNDKLKHAMESVAKGDYTGALVAKGVFGSLSSYMEFRAMDRNFIELKQKIYALSGELANDKSRLLSVGSKRIH